MLVPVAMVLVVEAKVEEEEAVEATVTKGSSGEAFLSLKSLLERGG